MDSFVVMHNPEIIGTLENFIRDFISKEPKRPCSFSGLKITTGNAAKGNFIYVVGWKVVGLDKIYELGYKFKSTANITAPKNKKHHSMWMYKNTIKDSEKNIDGLYFDVPVIIKSLVVSQWFDKKDNLMKEIPPDIVKELDKIFEDINAKSFI